MLLEENFRKYTVTKIKLFKTYSFIKQNLGVKILETYFIFLAKTAEIFKEGFFAYFSRFNLAFLQIVKEVDMPCKQ